MTWRRIAYYCQHRDNPFFEAWTTPFEAPPFARIKPEHFMPAYARAFAEHVAEIAAITGQRTAPTFDNTIVPLENAGRLLARVDDVFGHLVGTDTNDELLAIERDITPQTATHWNKVRMNAPLFARIDALHSEARQPRPHRRAEARAGALPHPAPPRRCRPRRRQEEAPRRDR